MDEEIESIDYGFYIKKSPLGDRVFKIGIFAIKHIYSRLGTYQNAFGPTYKERFETIWIGPEQDIRELERLIKIKYRSKIAGTSRGLTEWITDIDYESLLNDIEEEIIKLGVLVQHPEGFENIFEEDIERLQNYVQILMESKID